MFSSNRDPRFFINVTRAILASPRQRLAMFTFVSCCLVPIMINFVLLSYYDYNRSNRVFPWSSKSNCIHTMLYGINCICEDVESALKERYNWVSLAYAWAWGRYSLMTSNHHLHRSWIVEDTSMILEGHHSLTGSSLKVSGRKKRVEIY